MWQWIRRWFGHRKHNGVTIVTTPFPQLVLTEACMAGLAGTLEPAMRRRHEGIAYLLGLTDGETTVAVAAFHPEARTTAGSFAVSAIAMAAVVRAANDAGLHVVGQVHTHPTMAAHSDGDIAGARIRYAGYVSIVLPCYGRQLPDLTNAACYLFRPESGFILLDAAAIHIIGARLP